MSRLASLGFDELPVTWKHGVTAGALPPHHRDPFDRMLVAQAKLEGCSLVTSNDRLASYDIDLIRA